MEKLPAARQALVKKMSDDRLRVKLIAVGYDEDEVLALERQDLLSRYAEVISSGRAQVGQVAVDPELERERLAFEKQKVEMEQKRWEAEMEMKKVEMEDKRRAEELTRQKLEVEHQRWLAEQERDKRKAEKEEKEKKANDGAVTAKLFGDVMRSHILKMGAEPLDALAFFKHVEQLFDKYEVPESMRASLINPYLNEKARRIVGKLSTEVATKYDSVKATILQEFKLSANTYLEKFNTCEKSLDETYVAFSSRLRGLLDYYLDSRKVTDFEKLRELLICDRVKSVLPDACLKHILSVESASEEGWLSLKALTESIDRYVAARGSEMAKPKAFAIGQDQSHQSVGRGRGFTPQQGFHNQQMYKPGGRGGAHKFVVDTSKGASNYDHTTRASGNMSPKVKFIRCYECGEVGHVKANCPNTKVKTPVSVKRVTLVPADVTGEPVMPLSQHKESVQSQIPNVCSNVVEQLTTDDVSELVSSEFVDLIVEEMNQSTVVHDVQNNTVDCAVDRFCTNTDIFSDLSCLKYIDVCIKVHGDDVCKPIAALIDSGAEISVIKA